MTDNPETPDNDELAAERDRLTAEVMRLRVERETGVPASMLSMAMTEEQARAQAAEALAWRGDRSAAPPQTVAPYANGVGQYSRETVGHLSPEQVSEAYHQGRLRALGAPAPPPRTNGERRAM
jgi:Zn-dependent M32 family carboxypeptidase